MRSVICCIEFDLASENQIKHVSARVSVERKEGGAIAVVAVSAHAERKRDILGLHPGMSYQEAMAAMAKNLQGQAQEHDRSFFSDTFAPCQLLRDSLRHSRPTASSSFDHLVGAQPYQWGNRKVKRLGGPEV
jgi:hypothetical protein